MSASPLTTRVIGRYAIYQALASGGMATVYLGRLLGPVGFARTVAIKRLHAHFAADPKFVTMFLDEARIAARVRHPNVVPTLDVVTTQGELFLVMEYVHGESLGKLIRIAAEEGTAIPVPVVVAIMSGVLQGLHAAHEAKSERGVPLEIIHRDVSPQNVLVGRDGQARLLDFGVARAEERLHTTQEGIVKGKLAYMAPEQVRGEALGPPTDIYAAAAVMWEALVGRPLFRGTGEGGMVVEVLEAKVTPPSRALREAGSTARADEVLPLDDVLMRAFARKKENRWQTAREMARELEASVVPATVSQVSDWVERIAGATLRERASVVTEMERSSAATITQNEVGVAIAATTEPESRNDWVVSDPKAASNVPTAKVPPGQAETLLREAGREDPHSSDHDPAPSTTADPVPHTTEDPTPRTTADPAPRTTADPAPHTSPLFGGEADAAKAPDGPAPALATRQPLPGTLLSVPSPVAEKNPRNIPRFTETLQSGPSPLREEEPRVPPAEKPVTAAARALEDLGEPTAPSRRSHRAGTAVAIVILVLGVASLTYAYLRAHATHATDAATTPAPAHAQ